MRVFDQAFFLPEQTELQRAFDYPYDAPEGAFVFADGTVRPFRDPAILKGRTAVLSVGSNRAPVQLRRKFGDRTVVPVTPAVLHDCDIVHAAMLGYYGAVPATAFPCKGCDVTLNVAWLDDDQLITMHRTEAISVAYDYVEIRAGAVSHIAVDGCHVVEPNTPVFGYSARSGVLNMGDGQPAGLSRIPARNRSFATMSQHQAAHFVRQITGHDDGRDMAQFIADMQSDRGARDMILNVLAEFRLTEQDPPWKIVPVTLDDIDAYL